MLTKNIQMNADVKSEFKPFLAHISLIFVFAMANVRTITFAVFQKADQYLRFSSD